MHDARENREERPRAKQPFSWGLFAYGAGGGLWTVVRTLALLTASLCLIGFGLLKAYDTVQNKYLIPVDAQNHTPVVVVIERGTSLSKIPVMLEDAGVVRSKTAFKYYMDFTGNIGKIKAGIYVFNPSMTMKEIAQKLVKGDGRGNVTSFLVPEGSTVERIADILVQDGLIADTEHFLELCRTGEVFANYSFVSDIMLPENEERFYMLEGYLFPARYEIYIGSDEETIIEKMLDKVHAVMHLDLKARAEELDMTVDEVLSLASLIEREAKKPDFFKVSAVFHNRLRAGEMLGSDVTVTYVLKKDTMLLTKEDLNVDSPYNTRKYTGLPLGPICNPGLEAIKAALFPDEEYIKGKYMYFVLTDPETGVLAFSKTQREHDKLVEKWRPVWEEFEEKIKNQQNQ